MWFKNGSVLVSSACIKSKNIHHKSLSSSIGLTKENTCDTTITKYKLLFPIRTTVDYGTKLLS